MEKLIKLEKTEFPRVTNIRVSKYVINYVNVNFWSTTFDHSQLYLCVSDHKPPAMKKQTDQTVAEWTSHILRI